MATATGMLWLLWGDVGLIWKGFTNVLERRGGEG